MNPLAAEMLVLNIKEVNNLSLNNNRNIEIIDREKIIDKLVIS